jgi:hypothetical protein
MKKLIFTLLTMCSMYAASAQMNVIEGHINWDTAANNAMQGSFMVWLIEYDSSVNALVAVDSQTVIGYNPKYSFSGHATQFYLTKAAAVPGTVGFPYLLPSYHDSSFYWSSALNIFHQSGITSGKDIWMLQGINPGGPGFIGGNISAGANKGTGATEEGIMMALLNTTTNQIVKYTHTNGNGDYSFSNIPYGSYTVFPELMGYTTIPATGVTISATQPSITKLDFKKTPTHIKLIPAGINDLPAANLFSVYPNPADGSVKINYTSNVTGKVNISVVDVTGRQVMVKESDAKSNDQIDLSKLTSGTYFINIATDKATHSEQIVVKH